MSGDLSRLDEIFRSGRYTEDDIVSVVIGIVVPLFTADELGKDMPRILAFFGLSGQSTPEEMQRAIAARQPPDALVVEVLHAVRALVAEAGSIGADVARALWGNPAIQGALERKAPPPEGATAAGPLARFALRDTGDKKG